MEIIKKEGKDLETLLQEVCNENNLEQKDFYYRYSEKKSGLFNKNNTIELTVITKEELVNYIKNFLEELLTNMNLTVNFESKIRKDVIYIKLFTNNNPIIIGKNGNTLKSIENILKQKIITDLNIKPFISLDVENYREKQQKRLERLAKNLAKEVSKTKMEVHLENMNAYDRRIIHNALTNWKGIKTESTGEEPNRHVVIKPID